MNTGVVTVVSDTRTSWRLAAFLAVAGVAAIVFVAIAAIPYYLSASYGPPDLAAAGGGGRRPGRGIDGAESGGAGADRDWR